MNFVMGTDFYLVIRWWGTLFLIGAVAYPLTRVLFPSWFDRGYFFSKAVGMAVASWIVYVLGTIRILPFGDASIWVGLAAVFVGGIGLSLKKKSKPQVGSEMTKRAVLILVEEIFFFGALLFWSWIKGHEPTIRGLEKFMDYGFMKSILTGQFFPPSDMWYAGFSINYYYFGHLVTAFLTKLSGIDLAYTFNLMLATIFALTLTMSFGIGLQLLIGRIGRIGQIAGGLLTALLVTLSGNMQTIYAFTPGYTGEDVKPFWILGWAFPEGLVRYWYANATRFIPFTIHEFPSYSFVVSDVHGHVLSIPFTLLAIALLIALSEGLLRRRNVFAMARLVFYGFLVGVLLMTNALDGPIYLGLLIVILGVSRVMYHVPWKEIVQKIGIVTIVAAVTSLPFLAHFKSFVSGLAINCPPAFLADTKIGPFLFEGVEKCQHSPLWMLWLLWGFFIFCGGWLIATMKKRVHPLLLVFFLFSVALIIFPEFFYFKDIYPAHFRSNTMFKLGYQAFILFSIVSAYAIVKAIQDKRRLFLLLLLPQLFLVSIYPYFSVRSYFGELREYQGLYGLAWLVREYPDDLSAIEWFNKQVPSIKPVLVEGVGESYTDASRISAFTGLPTIVGWPVHEWLWRGSYDVVSPREEEVRTIFESEDIDETVDILDRYNVTHIVVGTFEKTNYPALQEEKISELGTVVFRKGDTTVYEITR
jgi:uncharacterized membrane protein